MSDDPKPLEGYGVDEDGPYDLGYQRGEQAGFERGRAEERDAEVAAHLKAEIAKLDGMIALGYYRDDRRAALVDTLDWLERR